MLDEFISIPSICSDQEDQGTLKIRMDGNQTARHGCQVAWRREIHLLGTWCISPEAISRYSKVFYACLFYFILMHSWHQTACRACTCVPRPCPPSSPWLNLRDTQIQQTDDADRYHWRQCESLASVRIHTIQWTKRTPQTPLLLSDGTFSSAKLQKATGPYVIAWARLCRVPPNSFSAPDTGKGGTEAAILPASWTRPDSILFLGWKISNNVMIRDIGVF